MKLSRCKDQKSSLEVFYGELRKNDDHVSQMIGKTMLSLIARLNALPDIREVWGLTSHAHLCLLAQNDYRSPWFIKIIGFQNQYSIQYLMPAGLAPWPNAYVSGETDTEDKAVEMILIAMDKSEGWKRTE